MQQVGSCGAERGLALLLLICARSRQAITVAGRRQRWSRRRKVIRLRAPTPAVVDLMPVVLLTPEYLVYEDVNNEDWLFYGFTYFYSRYKTTSSFLEGIEIDRTELSDNKFIKMLMIISFSVYYLAKSLQVFLLAGTATHLGLALKFYLSILFSVSSFFFFLFLLFRDLICLPAFSDQHLSCVSY